MELVSDTQEVARQRQQQRQQKKVADSMAKSEKKSIENFPRECY